MSEARESGALLIAAALMSIVLNEQSIDFFDELTQFLCDHKDELCPMNYSMLKTEMICQLHMIALEIDNEINKIYDTLLCNFSNQCVHE